MANVRKSFIALSPINRKPSTVTLDSLELMGYRLCYWGVFILSPGLVPPSLLMTPTLCMGQFEKGVDEMKCGTVLRGRGGLLNERQIATRYKQGFCLFLFYLNPLGPKFRRVQIEVHAKCFLDGSRLCFLTELTH